MHTLLVRTKLLIPSLSSTVVRRARLFQLLEDGLERKTTILSAPAGSGKTTLVASWLDDRRQRGNTQKVAWISLDKNDAYVTHFLSYLVAALQTVDSDTGHDARILLNRPQPIDVANVLTTLINDLTRLSDRLILVLDDYHVAQSPEIDEAVGFLVDHLPPLVHLLLITRLPTRLPLHRLRVASQSIEIDLQQLRFNIEEASAFLSRVMGLELPPETVLQLGTDTEGWVAGLQVAGLYLRGQVQQGIQPADALRSFDGKHRYVIDYMAEEVMRQLPAAQCQFLYHTSILDRLCAPLCDAVTHRNDSASVLDELEQANLFLVRLDQEHRWYRYHRLFQDFLRASSPPFDVKSLHCSASQWYAANGFLPDAIKHAIAAEDLSDARQLIEHYAHEVFDEGGSHILLHWLNALPTQFVSESSYLTSLKGSILCMVGEVGEAQTLEPLAIAHHRSDASPIHTGQLLCFRAALANSLGSPNEGIALATQALDTLAGVDSPMYIGAYHILAEAQRLAGDSFAAIRTLSKARRLGLRQRYQVPAASAVLDLAWLHYTSMRRREAVAVCQQAMCEFVNALRQTSLPGGLLHVALGFLCYEANDLVEARQHLEAGVPLARQLGIVRVVVMGELTLAKLYFATGETEKARQILLEARQSINPVGADQPRCQFDGALAWLELKLGNIPAAGQWAEGAGFYDTESIASRPLHQQLTCARLLLARGRPREALALLASIEKTARAEGRRYRLISVFALRSLCYHALGRIPRALRTLEQALRFAAPEGYVRSVIDEGPALISMLQSVRPVAPAFTEMALRGLSAWPGGQQVAHRESVCGDVLLGALTRRERDVLALAAIGLSNQAIADKLCITVGTTKWHLHGVYEKLGVRRQGVVAFQALLAPSEEHRSPVIPENTGLIPLEPVRGSAHKLGDAEPGGHTHLRIVGQTASGSEPLDISFEPLTRRERDVLTLAASGLSNQEIAGKLSITAGTTKWYLHRVFEKLGVRGRQAAASQARRLRLV